MRQDEKYPLRRVEAAIGVGLPLAEAPKRIKADYGINVTTLARQSEMEVAELARLLETRLLEGAYPWLNSVVIQGPFLNLKLEMGVFGTEVIDQVLKMGGDYGEENIGKGKIVAIDMSSPNIAKRMSYGHLRSTIIGDALANLYKAQGYEPIRDNHLGDWGTQFGNLIVAIKKWGNEPELMESSDPIGVLQDLYVKFHTRMEAEKDAHKISIKKVLIEEGAAAIPGLSEAIRRRTQDLIKKKKIPDEKLIIEDAINQLAESDLETEGREWFLRLEQGDPEAKRLWKMCINMSMREFDKVYSTLGVKFDVSLGESFYEDKMAGVIDEVRTSGVGRQSEGALVVDMNDKGLGVAIVQKSDGATLYMTRDLACALYREAKMGAKKAIYVVGEDQQLYFKQLFEILKRLGHPIGEESEHVYFGLVRLAEGKMSTRRGRTILLKDVIEEGLNRADKVLGDRNHERVDPEMRSKIVRQIAVGALKWNDLGQDPRKPIVFDWDKALKLEGCSAPYVQYAGVRARHILEASGVDIKVSNFDTKNTAGLFASESEKDLIKAIAGYPETVAEARSSNNPSRLAAHLYEIAKRFNLFYNSTPVIRTEDPRLKESRIKLVAASLQVIFNGLAILGIEIPVAM
ncbi:MAG: Arginine-tRNA ligase [Candidatus Amesbacteria bacterium GW2011_GWB1_47_26]|uniref:Arginine--tRNA ligase n=1 Tax=Candidatus Amesbacteria bacterium GW2011_GWC2_45_19 TaxID=1618366 RepID=A0A0G1M359_9BACT|nr:MAG: Arginine-tRNA ligase [Candidatus Amesbacteria bacterium GW2011_GWC2_45_19]KKU38113.1 MAG: Arginine-tRNA ligase [Candidatus Amesbacteria bacterium GW2011_GWA1_46_35]KKU69085.1 MAG: Arginine-tRNA ligase [Microgenomates group bacterium GW2011_GWC1_47_20]KKU74772.1 MAG: Arginine-tRNA ligase [Candidatus Amesbacteria bacterium GW2011_GWB1_47_26]KKU80203.1 MAG: Arginine-tRNA ligase [Candidatus Amesbacteria bacterium GW2011_GWA2_47_70]